MFHQACSQNQPYHKGTQRLISEKYVFGEADIARNFLLLKVKISAKWPFHLCTIFEFYLINALRFSEVYFSIFHSPYLKLDTVLSDSTPGHFVNIWQSKWDWIRSIKFETVQILFHDVVGLLASTNFAITSLKQSHNAISHNSDPGSRNLKMANGCESCLAWQIFYKVK